MSERMEAEAHAADESVRRAVTSASLAAAIAAAVVDLHGRYYLPTRVRAARVVVVASLVAAWIVRLSG